MPTELTQLYIRIFQTIRSGDLAQYGLHTHYSIFLNMNISDIPGAQLRCGGHDHGLGD